MFAETTFEPGGSPQNWSLTLLCGLRFASMGQSTSCVEASHARGHMLSNLISLTCLLASSIYFWDTRDRVVLVNDRWNQTFIGMDHWINFSMVQKEFFNNLWLLAPSPKETKIFPECGSQLFGPSVKTQWQLKTGVIETAFVQGWHICEALLVISITLHAKQPLHIWMMQVIPTKHLNLLSSPPIRM